jgi:hypothetical protein
MPEGSTDTDDQGLPEDEPDDSDEDECETPADIFRSRTEDLGDNPQTR